MKEDGCTAVVMEVSSHALRQHRVAGCAFDAMVFTNLSREHLDFHPDMEDYFAAKAMLFRELVEGARRDGKDPAVVINQDDDWGRKLQKLHLADPARAFSYSIRMPTADIAISLAGTRLRVDGMELFSPLVGEFNASNLMAAVTLGRALGLGAEQISRGLAALKGVPGRLERVPVPGDRFAVFVDYAHKPDALEKVLTTLREIVRGSGNGRLVTVFGCGGDRDRGKRPLMGAISERLSDVTWITSDNPRTEMPQAIIDEVLAGLSLELKGNASKVHVEMDRARAIEGAIHDAREGDVILIAGKGHEDYQLLLDPSSGGVGPKRSIKVPFDDRKVAASAIAMVRKC
jgi:UDP-N-acetylmuramoyl-L-alanyl-D-glutamate--2,6-diaminopimelate ligase